MTGATHFLEVTKHLERGKISNGKCQPIKDLEGTLMLTRQLQSLKTIAVWKVKQKTNAVN